MAAITLLGLLLVASSIDVAGAQSIGVCYGMLGNNLPSLEEVIQLYNSRNITRMRLYEPNHGALQALRGSNIEVMLGIPNSDLEQIASGYIHASSWVQKNVRDFWPDVKLKYIVVGNEISPFTGTSHLTKHLVPVMSKMYTAIYFYGLKSLVNVTTAIDMTLVGSSYPPSQGSFRKDAKWFVDPIVEHLRLTSAPLLVNIYPYFSYSDNPGQISLRYALFTAPNVVVQDGPFQNRNLFDAMLDSVSAVLDRSGRGFIEIVVSESGWPSAGAFAATTDNAQTYLRNLITHVERVLQESLDPLRPTYLPCLTRITRTLNLKNTLDCFLPTSSPNITSTLGFPHGVWDISEETNATAPLRSEM